MPHPTPEEAKIICAKDLKVGMLIYSPAGFMDSPEEFDGCWRRITAIEPDSKSDNDLRVSLEKFAGEEYELVDWYFRHTLAIVHLSTAV